MTLLTAMMGGGTSGGGGSGGGDGQIGEIRQILTANAAMGPQSNTITDSANGIC